MTRSTRPRLAPFSLRLTLEERQQLERRAGGAPLAAYIKSRLFDAENPAKDIRGLAKLLAMLGRSNIAANLRELAALARNGCLLVTPETESAIQEACRNISDIRSLLMRALGLKP